jgi:ParB family transcriptional regulator, chromosome partitioning protein
MTRKALGRGLGALLSAETLAPEEDPHLFDIRLIDPNPVQPRTHFDDSKLEELAQSIRANGIVQPLILRKKGPRYELVAGERRWRAAERAGLTEVPAVVREVPDEKLLELALIENIQREELNPIEEAGAYKKLIETVGLTQELVAKRVGRDRSYITNYLRLLRLPADLQALVQDGKLSTGHARTLLGLDDTRSQQQLAAKIIAQDLSVRETERLVRAICQARSETSPSSTKASVSDPNLKAAETKLRRRFGTKVRIIQNRQTLRGKIEFEFFNNQELDRLYNLLLPRDESRP